MFPPRPFQSSFSNLASALAVQTGSRSWTLQPAKSTSSLTLLRCLTPTAHLVFLLSIPAGPKHVRSSVLTRSSCVAMMVSHAWQKRQDMRLTDWANRICVFPG
jgi:hypothetical protein